MKNIIAHLGSQVFPRIKVGVGEKPAKYDLADYVLGWKLLGRLPREELDRVDTKILDKYYKPSEEE